MERDERAALEREIRGRWDLADFPGAATIAIRGYGPQIYGFILAFRRSEADASDVFSAFTERLWRGLPSFHWGCSFRTWAYTIALNASRSQRSDARRQAARFSPLPDGSELSALEGVARTATQSYLKTHNRTRIAALRDALSEDDQLLLSLRIDRRLSFVELAHVFHGADAALSEEELKRSAARLRKRFQGVKERLVTLGVRDGIIKPAGAED